MPGPERHQGADAGFGATNVRGIVGLAGPYDFKFDTPLLRGIFGTATDPAGEPPISYARGPAPPAGSDLSPLLYAEVTGDLQGFG